MLTLARTKEVEKEMFLDVVIDARFIQEKSSGSVSFKDVPVYRFAKDKKELKIVDVFSVKDDEFISEFNESLSQETEEKVLNALINSDIDTSRKKGIDF